MQAIILNIDSRDRQRISQIASLNDFTYTPGIQIDPEAIINNPDISLYCLDETHQWAIFTELPANINLAIEPFYYQAQFDHAQRLFAVAYDLFYKLADEIDVDMSKLILIHNIGRCGSTLLNKVFNQLDNVMCLSEPDVFSGFALMRHHDQSTLTRLLQSSLRLMFRPVVTNQITTYGLKFRNQCVEIMDLFATAFPQAKHLFLYRNVLDWTASLERLMSRHGSRPPITRTEAMTLVATYHNRTVEQVEPFLDPSVKSCSTVTYLAISWLVMMDRYVELYTQGVTPLAVRYEDLTTQREAVISSIFDYCGLPSIAIRSALQAFTSDSQQGTPLAREQSDQGNTYTLSDEQIAQIRAILKRHPMIHTPDFTLPGTLTM